MKKKEIDREKVTGGMPEDNALRIGRRSVIKVGVATAIGLALGPNYVKPSIVSAVVRDSYLLSDQMALEQAPQPARGSGAFQ